MTTVKLTILRSDCRGGYHKAGETYYVEDLCPPICKELWYQAYPYIFALQNGGELDYQTGIAKQFDVHCPDGGRVLLHGEVVQEGDPLWKR